MFTNRRILLLFSMLVLGAATMIAAQARRSRPPVPAFDRPVMFDTPEADRVLAALQVFPPDNPWNEDISALPVHRESAKIVAGIGADKPLHYNLDMGFVLVPPNQARVPVKLLDYPAESDPGPYPVPDNAPIENWPLQTNEDAKALPKAGQTLEQLQREGTGDRHVIVVDPINGKLHEFWQARKTDAGWQASNAATFDLKTGALRPERWTSADAAGLPIFPAVVRYDECERGSVEHAMRFTVRRTRRAYVLPATHWASKLTDPTLPRMGERFRLRPDFDISGFPPHAQAILKGLKRYGMFVADNGSDWYMSIAPDRRLKGLETLTRVKGSDFEVVDTGARSVEDAPLAQPPSRGDVWRILGPGGGGATLHPTISPHDPKVAVEACDMTGSYITHDGGESWRMFNLGTVATAFAFDPRDPAVIYAGASAVFRSADAGRTWQMIFPNPARDTVKHGWGDHAETIYTTDDPLYPSGQNVVIHSIGVDEGNPNQVFVAMQSRKAGPPGSSEPEATTVLVSSNRGATWTALGDLPPQRVFAVWAGSGVPGVHVLAESGVFAMIGQTWQPGAAPPRIRFDSGGVGRDSANGATLIYATAALSRDAAGKLAGGVYVSTDAGARWRQANSTLGAFLVAEVGAGETWGPARGSRPHLGPLSASARHGLTAYVGVRGLRDPKGPGKPFNGVAKTSDGGRTWSIVHRDADQPAANFAGSWIETRGVEDGYSVWLDAPYDIGTAPGDPRVCYVTDLFRTYRTFDGGRTWAQVNSRQAGAGWVSRGLDVTNHYGMVWDPFDPKRVLVPSTDIGLFRSDDATASWVGSSNGIPRSWRNTSYWVAFDPEVKDLVWGAFSGTHDLPRPKMWRRTDPATFKGGVAVSTDGGRHWKLSNDGMPESAITHLLVDPRSPRGQRALYATAFGRGVYKSIDNGRTWSLKNAGLPPDPRQQPFAWRLALDPAGTLYLVVARRSERGRIGDPDDGALYVSRDGAEHWAPLPLPKGTNGPNGLTIDPRDPRRLYLSAWAAATPGGDSGGGIFISDDAGASWRRAKATTEHVYDVTIDPRNPDIMYAGGFDQGVFRSTDRGETWHRIAGFNFKWGHRVVPDPSDPTRIYVTTFGGGIWHGPASGDAAATEDVTTGREPTRR